MTGMRLGKPLKRWVDGEKLHLESEGESMDELFTVFVLVRLCLAQPGC